MAWTDPTTRATGFVVTAAIYNADIINNLKEIGDAWSTFTPTWGSTGVAPAVGNGSIVGRWISAGKLAIFDITLTLGSTSTVGTLAYTFTLPATAARVGNQFTGTFRDSSASNSYLISGEVLDSGRTFVNLRQSAASPISNLTAASPVVPANGDTYYISGVYEVA